MKTYRVYYLKQSGSFSHEVSDLFYAKSLEDLLDDLDCLFLNPKRIFLITSTLVYP